jgi:DNA-binding FadR family transcriptional regulator
VTFQRIDRSRRFIEVTRQLRQSIFNGEYGPGERLPSERELTEQFGVSRIIVREAIWDLKKSGIVEIKRGAHGGAFVQEMKHDAVTSVMHDVLTMGGARPADIVAVRLILEPTAAELAALNATAEDIQAIEKHLQNPPAKMSPETIKWSIEFHRLVAKASHNLIFSLLVNILLDFTENLILGLFRTHVWDKVYHDDQSHPAILKKIFQEDANGAKQLFYDHLLDIKPVFDSWEEQFDVNCFG